GSEPHHRARVEARRGGRGAGRVPPLTFAGPLRPRPRVLPRLPSRHAHRGRLRRLDQRVGHRRSRSPRVSAEARPALATATNLGRRWWMTPRSIIDRMVGTPRLQPAVYEEAEADQKAT